MNAALVRVAPEEIAAQREPIRAIFAAAFAMPPGEATRFMESLSRHATRRDFRFLAAREPDNGALLGFVYGYTSEPGQWFHDLVREALGPELAARWLADTFEFVAFGMRPEWQGRGLGGWLHDAVLADLPHRTAILSTLPGNTNALTLYRKRGWVALRRDYHFPGHGKAYILMGKDLRQIMRGSF